MRLDETCRIVVASLAFVVLGCAKTSKESGPPPASLVGKKSEAEISRITLTPEAETRLGVEIVSAVRRDVPRTRAIGADVIPASGRSLVTVAPVAGRVGSAGSELRVGQRVKRGDPMLRLTPVATVDRDLRTNADRTVSVGNSRLVAMEARLARAEKMLETGAGSVRAVEEARAERDTAKADVDAANNRITLLQHSPLEADVAVTLRAPEDGVVRAITAPSGMLVPGGAPLFELVGTGVLWVRASVFVGDLRSIRPDVPARIRALTAPPAPSDLEAFPVNGPPTADPAAATFDLYFSLPTESNFRPGERVSVSIAYIGQVSEIEVPASAVMRDVGGSAWVYEATGERRYERRHVEVDRVNGSNLLLTRGIQDGARIVSQGAAELFGFEFGTGK